MVKTSKRKLFLNKTQKNNKSNRNNEIIITYKTFEDKLDMSKSLTHREIIKLLQTPYLPSSIKKNDDYYSYVNYVWLKSVKATKEQSNIVRLDDFRIVQNNVISQLYNMIKEYIKHDKTSPRMRDISNAFISYNVGTSYKAIQNYAHKMVEKLDELRGDNNLWKLLGYLNQNEIISWGIPISYNLSPDEKNPQQYRCHINGPKVTLLDLSLYFEDEAPPNKKEYVKKYKKNYNEYLEKLFTFVFGVGHKYDIKDIYIIEKQIIESYVCIDTNTTEDTYNKITTAESSEKYGFNFTEFSKYLGFSHTPSFFITSSPNYLKCCSKLLIDNWNSEQWRTYFVYINIRQMVRLNQEGYRLYYSFNGKFALQQQQPLDDRFGSILFFSLSFNTLLTNMYIDKYENRQYIEYLKILAEDLKTCFVRIVKANDWMMPSTKKNALKKLKYLKLIVGTPKLLREDPLLGYTKDDAWGNLMKIVNWRFKKALKLEGKAPVDIPEIDWSLTPPKFIGSQAYIVNASYTPSTNSIYVPMGYIQKPFIDLDERGIEYNLANIGFTLAHEMSHVLDDFGSKYDYTGKMVDWWTPQDKKHFKSIQLDVIEQYRVFAKYDGIDFDATSSIGEDLADISGVNICMHYLSDFQYKNADIIPIRELSYNAFFIYFAYQMKQSISKKALETELIINPHPPDKYRTNVPLSRNNIFRAINNIKEKDKMFWKNTNKIYEK